MWHVVAEGADAPQRHLLQRPCGCGRHSASRYRPHLPGLPLVSSPVSIPLLQLIYDMLARTHACHAVHAAFTVKVRTHGRNYALTAYHRASMASLVMRARHNRQYERCHILHGTWYSLPACVPTELAAAVQPTASKHIQHVNKTCHHLSALLISTLILFLYKFRCWCVVVNVFSLLSSC